MDPLVEINVALWGFIVPMFGAFSFVRFKRGGPYGQSGKYISTGTALGLLAATALFSHFILSPLMRVYIESLCMSNSYMGYFLAGFAFVVMWLFISRSRRS